MADQINAIMIDEGGTSGFFGLRALVRRLQLLISRGLSRILVRVLFSVLVLFWELIKLLVGEPWRNSGGRWVTASGASAGGTAWDVGTAGPAGTGCCRRRQAQRHGRRFQPPGPAAQIRLVLLCEAFVLCLSLAGRPFMSNLSSFEDGNEHFDPTMCHLESDRRTFPSRFDNRWFTVNFLNLFLGCWRKCGPIPYIRKTEVYLLPLIWQNLQ